MPGVAPTVQRMPTVACARACGAEHDPDSGVICVQIAATMHDTVNSCSPDAGGELCRMYVVVTQVQAQRGHVRPGPARARPGPGVLRAEGTGRRPATTGLRTSISNPFETVKSADFRGKICVVNGGKYAFSLSGLVPNSELSGFGFSRCHLPRTKTCLAGVEEGGSSPAKVRSSLEFGDRFYFNGPHMSYMWKTTQVDGFPSTRIPDT